MGNTLRNEIVEDILVWIPVTSAFAATIGYLVRWLGIRVFASSFAQKAPSPPSGRSDAIMTLQKLDSAIRSIHPEKYYAQMDPATELNSLRMSINTMLGRHESERFFPVEYQTFVGRIAFYSSRGLLSEIERVSRDLPVVNALILGALHEARISAQGLKHDGVNLGAEVQCSTKALLDLVNNGASRRFEATPSF